LAWQQQFQILLKKGFEKRFEKRFEKGFEKGFEKRSQSQILKHSKVKPDLKCSVL
jgi:hypothetical protein